MAATAEEIIRNWRGFQDHQGFGQESVVKARKKPSNVELAFFVQAHLRAPESQAELDAFTKARLARDGN